MKNYFWIILSSALLFIISCKKELGNQLTSEAERAIPYSNQPSHCYNNIRDFEKGETDVDCGGPCLACQEATPTCLIAPDTAIINNIAYKIIYTGQTSQSSVTSYQFSILNTPYSNVYGKIHVHNDHTVLEPSSVVNSFPGKREIEITYSNYNTWGASYKNAVGGQAYINTRVNGLHEITVCSSTFSTVFYNNQKDISFKLLIP